MLNIPTNIFKIISIMKNVSPPQQMAFGDFFETTSTFKTRKTHTNFTPIKQRYLSTTEGTFVSCKSTMKLEFLVKFEYPNFNFNHKLLNLRLYYLELN